MHAAPKMLIRTFPPKIRTFRVSPFVTAMCLTKPFNQCYAVPRTKHFNFSSHHRALSYPHHFTYLTVHHSILIHSTTRPVIPNGIAFFTCFVHLFCFILLLYIDSQALSALCSTMFYFYSHTICIAYTT